MARLGPVQPIVSYKSNLYLCMRTGRGGAISGNSEFLLTLGEDLPMDGISATVPTGDFLVHRHIVASANCVLCNSVDNSAAHILFGCPFATQLWTDSVGDSLFRGKNMNNMIEPNSSRI